MNAVYREREVLVKAYDSSWADDTKNYIAFRQDLLLRNTGRLTQPWNWKWLVWKLRCLID